MPATLLLCVCVCVFLNTQSKWARIKIDNSREPTRACRCNHCPAGYFSESCLSWRQSQPGQQGQSEYNAKVVLPVVTEETCLCPRAISKWPSLNSESSQDRVGVFLCFVGCRLTTQAFGGSLSGGLVLNKRLWILNKSPSGERLLRNAESFSKSNEMISEIRVSVSLSSWRKPWMGTQSKSICIHDPMQQMPGRKGESGAIH